MNQKQLEIIEIIGEIVSMRAFILRQKMIMEDMVRQLDELHQRAIVELGKIKDYKN